MLFTGVTKRLEVIVCKTKNLNATSESILARPIGRQSSVILRRPQKFNPYSTYNLTLLNNVKKMEDGTHFCGLLRTSELYKENLKQ